MSLEGEEEEEEEEGNPSRPHTSLHCEPRNLRYSRVQSFSLLSCPLQYRFGATLLAAYTCAAPAPPQ